MTESIIVCANRPILPAMRDLLTYINGCNYYFQGICAGDFGTLIRYLYGKKIMTKYEDYVLTDDQKDTVRHFNAHKSIIRYIMENGTGPEDPDSFFTASDDDLEKARSVLYVQDTCSVCSKDTSSSVGLIAFIDETFQNAVLAEKYEYQDSDFPSSKVGSMVPYFIYNGTDKFSFYVSIDGVRTYIVNDEGDELNEEIDDEFIANVKEGIGASSYIVSMLTSQKGKRIVDGHTPSMVGGIEYNGMSYWQHGSSYNDIQEYRTDDRSASIWIQASVKDMIENGQCSPGDVITVKHHRYDDTMSGPVYEDDIEVTATYKYV